MKIKLVLLALCLFIMGCPEITNPPVGAGGQGPESSREVVKLPEPATGLLLVSGLGLLWVFRKKLS